MAFDQSLSRRERQVMDAIFQAGEATAAQVQETMPDPPGYTAVRTTLRILEEKGFVDHRVDGKRFVFRPRRSSGVAGRSALQRVLHVFFGGSLEQALAAHLSDPNIRLDNSELRRMRELIKELEKKEGPTEHVARKGKKQ